MNKKTPLNKNNKLVNKRKDGKPEVVGDDNDDVVVYNDDDDDEEDEEENEDEVVEDLIDDNPIEEEESDVEVKKSHKKRKRRSEKDYELDEEDLDLIEENTNTKIARRKRKRVIESDDDEEGVLNSSKKKSEPFPEWRRNGGDSDNDDDRSDKSSFTHTRVEDVNDQVMESEEDLDENEEDDFIADDDDDDCTGSKSNKRHKLLTNRNGDRQMQEAYEVFGGDFEFGDVINNEEDDVENIEEEMENDEEEESESRTREKPKQLEPGELEQSYLTNRDHEIITTDVPERFQVRTKNVCPTTEGELEDESYWIYKNAFNTSSISRQNHWGITTKSDHSNFETVIEKIGAALNLMRNENFEVPFIAFYRKELVQPELSIADLWKIYDWDEKWMHFKSKKENLFTLFKQLQVFQSSEEITETFLIRPLTKDDIERLKDVETFEQLKDMRDFYDLHYSKVVRTMKIKLKKTLVEENNLKDKIMVNYGFQTSREKAEYDHAIQAGLYKMAENIGLKTEQFAENLKDNYQRHEVTENAIGAQEVAQEFVKGRFSTVESVLRGVRNIAAMQIAHDPTVRSCLRQVIYEKGKLNVQPTAKGKSVIDESHSCYFFRRLKNKPIKDLIDDQFLKIHEAEMEGLLNVEIDIKDKTDEKDVYLDEVKQLFTKDEYSSIAQEWNKQRAMIIDQAFTGYLYPYMIKEIKNKLIEEANAFVISTCCRKLYDWLKIAPYEDVDQLDDEYDEDACNSDGVKILGLAYSAQEEEASFCAVVDGSGEVTDFLRLQHLCKRRNSWRKEDKGLKENDLSLLRELILSKRPNVIAVGGESKEVLMLVDDLKHIVSDLERNEQIKKITVELVDNELSVVYASVKQAEKNMKDFTLRQRQAVSIARRLQDPLSEFSQLCNSNDDILSIKFHPMQHLVPKEMLLKHLYTEFINRVCEVGVDINRCIAHPHTSNVIQFVSGLGPRKAFSLIKALKRNNVLLENRAQLSTLKNFKMVSKIYFNCAGFIKIKSDGELSDDLDTTRIHPESYEWARKMAIDALEYEDENATDAVKEIFERPENLKDLDLDAYAANLKEQGYGDKTITLYDIKTELTHSFKDLRTPYRSPNEVEIFNLLTKETPETFYIGQLICCKVIGYAYQKFQNSDAVGVRTILDNGVIGFIPKRSLIDGFVTKVEDVVKVNSVMNSRIVKITPERFNVELTSKPSDIEDNSYKWRKPKMDAFYDYETENDIKEKNTNKEIQKVQSLFTPRNLTHPAFKNVDYATCEHLMQELELGDVIIRPSSKGEDLLSLAWKVYDGVVQHIQVKEENKANMYSLGKSLYIGNELFEDFDEIIARFVQPMASYARDVMNHKYFKELSMPNLDNKEFIDNALLEEKKVHPNRIPYLLTVSKRNAGSFLLSYLPKTKVFHEYVTVTQDGIKYRQTVFRNLSSLINWFKEHWIDPIPVQSHASTFSSSMAH